MSIGNPNVPPPSAPGLRGNDLVYALYRHKWKILFFSFTGLIAGGAVLFFSQPKYASTAELLVKYIVENRSLTADDATSNVRAPREDNVVNSEIGILSSMDLAREVAIETGPTNIAPVVDPAMDPVVAATIAIRKGLEVAPRGKTPIINLRFEHPNPTIARSVLTNLVAAYLRAHARIHRSPDFLNDLQKEADQRRSALERVGEELRRIKSELKVSSVEDARRTYQEEIARTRREISVAEMQLAERTAAAAAMNGLQRQTPPASTTNEVAAEGATTQPTNAIPTERLAEYRSLRIRIDELTRREQALLVEYTDLSPRVQGVRQLLATNQAELARLEAEYPALAFPSTPLVRAGGEPMTAAALPFQGPSPALEIPAIEARLRSLTNQLDKLRGEALQLDEREAEFEAATRRKEIEEKRYIHLATALGQAGIDQALTQGRAANISVIQQPTPAERAQTKILKIAGGLAGGGIAFALALAFGIEMVTDQSLRRRAQVESSLRVPVFLSIPRLRLRPRRAVRAPKALPRNASGTPLPASGTEGGSAGGEAGHNGRGRASAPPSGPPVDADPALATYVEALRDRLIMHFESEGLERKPKLVGLTSCGHGAGVTTLATALAASLSETGDGNVLYVDMDPHRGPSVMPFQRGESKVALPQAFEGGTRAAAQVNDRLYAVSLAEPGTRRVGVVPKTLAALMPKMKASDYDYIIFDFPPITQTSVTTKVTGLLDMTFLVVESEKTHGDLAKNALALMGQGRAKVTAVLNKHKRYVPRRFDPDL